MSTSTLRRAVKKVAHKVTRTLTKKRRPDIIPRIAAAQEGPSPTEADSFTFEPIIPEGTPIQFPTSPASIMYGGTSFWEHHSAGHSLQRFNNGCFGTLNYSDSQSITFLCTLPANITPQIARFWLRFLRHTLRDIPWTAQLCTVDLHGHPGHRCILYRLPKMVKNRWSNLVYLTLFRYPSMHSPAVTALYRDRAKAGDSPDQLFRLFQQIHTITGNYRGISLVDGHQAVKPVRDQRQDGTYHYSSWTPVPLSTFRAKVRSGRARSVYDHFARSL